LSQNALGDTGAAEGLVPLLTGPAAALETLGINAVGLGDDGMTAVAEWLPRTLTALNCGDNRGAGAAALLAALPELMQLKVIYPASLRAHAPSMRVSHRRGFGGRGLGKGDIGIFGSHCGSPALDLLRDCGTAAAAANQQNAVINLVRQLGGRPHAQPLVFTAASLNSSSSGSGSGSGSSNWSLLLSTSAREALIERLDTAHRQNRNRNRNAAPPAGGSGGGGHDLKLDLSETELGSLIGDTVRTETELDILASFALSVGSRACCVLCAGDGGTTAGAVWTRS
jgi:hypothetical protein